MIFKKCNLCGVEFNRSWFPRHLLVGYDCLVIWESEWYNDKLNCIAKVNKHKENT